MTYECLLYEVKDGIATLTLNRPDRLNALGGTLREDLLDAITRAGADPEVRVMVVTGAGKGFCAGGDVKAMNEANEGQRTRPLMDKIAPSRDRTLFALRDAPQPIIAAVNGAAIGLGATIALFCDVVIASEKARFGDLHVKAGIVAGDGGQIIWPLLVGLNKAKELLMTADIIDAKEAYRLGVCQRLVPHEKVMEEAMGLATRFANGPLLAIRWTKQALNKQLWERTIQLAEFGGALEMLSGHHPDQKEATTAFVQHRTPTFKATIE